MRFRCITTGELVGSCNRQWRFCITKNMATYTGFEAVKQKMMARGMSAGGAAALAKKTGVNRNKKTRPAKKPGCK